MTRRSIFIIATFVLLAEFILITILVALVKLDLEYFESNIPENFITSQNNYVISRLESLRDRFIFYGFLLSVSTLGIIELLPEIRKRSKSFQLYLGGLYVGLVLALNFSVFQVWITKSESVLLTRIHLESWEPYRIYAEKFNSMIDAIFLSPLLSKILVVLAVLAITFFFLGLYEKYLNPFEEKIETDTGDFRRKTKKSYN